MLYSFSFLCKFSLKQTHHLHEHHVHVHQVNVNHVHVHHERHALETVEEIPWLWGGEVS